MVDVVSARSECSLVCGVVGGLMGVVTLFLARESQDLFVAVLLGALIGASVWWMLTTFVCAPGEDKPAKPAPAPEKVEEKPAEVKAEAAPESAPQEAPAKKAADDGGAKDYDGDGVEEGEDEGVKPAALDGPREGGADDLKKIKGVGPKLEGVLHGLGFYHFDQIAAWTADEVAWVDANLTGFRGRVSRDDWVAQATALAAGEETEFSKKVAKGDVY